MNDVADPRSTSQYFTGDSMQVWLLLQTGPCFARKGLGMLSTKIENSPVVLSLEMESRGQLGKGLNEINVPITLSVCRDKEPATH